MNHDELKKVTQEQILALEFPKDMYTLERLVVPKPWGHTQKFLGDGPLICKYACYELSKPCPLPTSLTQIYSNLSPADILKIVAWDLKSQITMNYKWVNTLKLIMDKSLIIEATPTHWIKAALLCMKGEQG